MSRRALVCLLLGLLACSESAPPAPPTTSSAQAVRPPEPDVDSDNLLNLAYGAAVVSRTGELNLERSAAHTIDGLVESVWISAPGVPEETIVYSLLGTARATSVGVSVVIDQETPDGVLFESSLDGERWSELARITPQRTHDRQFVRTQPTDLRFLRVRTLDRDNYYSRLRGVHLLGSEIAPPVTPSFGGCWTINGSPARIHQDGARITGRIESNPPITLDGGTDNRVALLMWTQGPMWGYAAVTRTPEGARLTGLRFFEEADSRHIGDAWFGERCEGGQAALPASDPAAILRTAQRYSAFGLAFDREGRLVEPLSARALEALAALQPQRIVVREFNGASAEINRRLAETKMATLRAALHARGVDVARIDFVAAGSDWDGPPLGSALQRALASRVDIIARL